MTTAYDTRLTTALTFMALQFGVDVEPTDDIVPDPCVHCGAEGAVAKVRVSAEPNPHETREDFRKECCHHCVPRLVNEAKAAHWDRAGHEVLVEVSL
ncbi:hypothetical protein SAMN05216188_11897 [Lentzea xinjiangensis]|uniref:Uncharacterized protein n=1 Tax=Lentzea xinjiangensis TaxID=402600 RepID=A0A1H9TGG1_9PSEU|nr:hypothetical protein [Lentzea xinjiangensis]SER96064.1 hypothetical protein SAMN05216188_11897 [Lentzea xinjiangensis]